MATDSLGIFQQTTLRLYPVRDGYMTGTIELLGVVCEVEAFSVEPHSWNVPVGARGRRLQEILEGLMLDDRPLQQFSLPGHEGKWLLFFYPGEDTSNTSQPL